ncbi:putative nuclease HARBI1 [Tachysurus ichikawai]
MQAQYVMAGFLRTEETHYNEVHSRARTVVERAISILKCRWRALDASGGRLLYHPAKVCKIVRACGVLHNIALRTGIPLPPDLPLPQHYDPEPQPPGRQEGYQRVARIPHLQPFIVSCCNCRTASVSTRPLLDVPDAEGEPLLFTYSFRLRKDWRTNNCHVSVSLLFRHNPTHADLPNYSRNFAVQ